MFLILKKLISFVLVFSFLTSLSHADNFLDGIEDFENGRFRESSLKLLPLANQGNLFAQTYVRYMANQEKILCPEDVFSFKDLTQSRHLQAIQDALKASIAKLRITGLANSFGIPTNKKRGVEELNFLLERKNSHALVVMGDLIKEGRDVSSFYKKSQKTPPSSNFYDDAVQEGYFLGVLRLKTIENPLSPIQKKILQVVEISKKVSPLGENPSQGQIYFSLFNYFKEKKEKEFQDLASNFCRMGAYHGHVEAQRALLKGHVKDREEGDFWIERAAYQGHPKAMEQFAWNLERAGNLTGAFEFYLKGAEAETADNVSFYNLGNVYHYGKGTPVNLEEALRCYRISYEKTKPTSPYEITDLSLFQCISDVLLKMENPEALEWLQAGVKQGETESIINSAVCLFNGSFGEKNLEKSLETLRLLTLEKYNTEALTLLSNLLIERKLQGTLSEWATVEKFLIENTIPSKLRNVDSKIKKIDPDSACYLLSILYLNGQNGIVPPDYKKAHLYLDQAMKRNFALAYFQRAQIYAFYEPKNDVKAFECYQRASELGVENSWNSLGVYYMNGGDGVLQNDVEAVKCFQKAMENDDNGLAHHNYAMMMRDNRGGLICDEEKLVLLLEEAARLGDETAWRALGVHYIQEEEKEKIDRAIMYFEEGKKAGDRKSDYNLLLLKVQKTPMGEEKFTALKELEDAVQDEKDPEVLFGCGCLFVFNRNLNEQYLEKGLKYLEEAIQNGSEEAKYLKYFLDHEKELRVQAEIEMRDELSGDKGIEAAGLVSVAAEKEPAVLAGLETMTVDEELEEPYQPIDYAALAEEKARNPKRKLQENNAEEGGEKKRLSKKERKILDFLDLKSSRQVPVQHVFSVIGDLIKEKGGSLIHSKKGIRVQIGSEKIFTHLQHGKRGGGHQSDMDGARLEGMRKLVKDVMGASAPE